MALKSIRTLFLLRLSINLSCFLAQIFVGGIELLMLTAAILFPSIGQAIDHLHIRKQNWPILKILNLKCKQILQKLLNKQNTFLIQGVCFNYQQLQSSNNLKLNLEKIKTQITF